LLAIIIVTGSNCDPPRASLLPLLAALSALPGTLGGRFGRCGPVAAPSHFPIAQNKDNPNRLLARGVPGGDIKQLLDGVWLITAELIHQGMTHHAGPKHRDDVSVGHSRELIELPGEALNVILEGFTELLSATFQVPRVARLHIRALDVANEDLLLPAVDDVSQ
jgi:hypothetical protein